MQPLREAPTRPDPPRGRVPLLRFAAVAYTLLAAAALAWNGWAGRPWAFADAAAATAGIRLGRDLGLGLAVGGAVIAASQILTRGTRWGAALARDLAEVVGPLSLSECVALALLSGFAEEAFFRGALQPRVGWLVASALFGLAHLAPRRSLWPWTGFAVIAGGIFGAMFEATGNLVAPVTAHTLINAVNLRLLSHSLPR